MRDAGMNGLVRGRKTRTTIPGKDGRRAGDLLNRDFSSLAPNQVWVTDFTYVPVYAGFVYVALVIDFYSRAIGGWKTTTAKDTAFVEQCLRMALWRHQHTGRLVPEGFIHHSDASSQYTSIRYTDTLALEGLQPSIGSVGDAYDNAATETMMGLFKNEAVAKESPFRTGALKTESDVIVIVFEWVHWYNKDRLHSALEHQTPEEYEQSHMIYKTARYPTTPPTKRRQDSRDGSVQLPAVCGCAESMMASSPADATAVGALGFLASVISSAAGLNGWAENCCSARRAWKR